MRKEDNLLTALLTSPPLLSRSGPEPGKVANKQKRHELHQQQKRAKAADKRERRTQRQEIRKELGDKASSHFTTSHTPLPHHHTHTHCRNENHTVDVQAAVPAT